MGTLMTLFMSSAVQCWQLLDTLVHRYTHDTLRADMEAFATSIHRQQTLTADPECRRAHDDVRRLRQHLQMEADRVEDRRRELDALRTQLSIKTAVIAHLRAKLAHPYIPVLETTAGHGHGYGNGDGDTRDAPWGGDPVCG